MTMVLSTDHWTLEEDVQARVVVLRRTGTPFADVDDIVRANDQAMACFRAEHRTWGVVVDMRHAPRRNDAEFENAMRHLRDRIGKSFARVALVLESAAGVLQVNRIARDEGASDKTFATLSEPAATRFARGG